MVEEELTKIDQQYEDLKDAEAELSGELVKYSLYAIGLIIFIGFFTSFLNNIYVMYIAIGVSSWVAFFYLISIAMAAGTIRAKRCEVGNQSEE